MAGRGVYGVMTGANEPLAVMIALTLEPGGHAVTFTRNRDKLSASTAKTSSPLPKAWRGAHVAPESRETSSVACAAPLGPVKWIWKDHLSPHAGADAAEIVGDGPTVVTALKSVVEVLSACAVGT